jgi:hypothetical protein
MRYLLLFVLTAGVAGGAQAQTASCKASAGEKKLAGAALASFMKRCESDATSACHHAAGARKLSGAARTSFTTRCLRDKVGG